MDDLPPPLPAATLILLRDAPRERAAGGRPELLMMQRARTMVFAAGAYVFPGGRVEEDDSSTAERAGLDPEEGGARVAAVRETIEECGLAVAVDPPPAPATLREWRAALAAGRPFSELLAEAGARVTTDRLTPYTHWLPPVRVARRYDTRFYVARAPADAPEPTSDGESIDWVWTTADAVLARYEVGEVELLFPTMCTLRRLAKCATADAVFADAAAFPAERVTIDMVEEDGARWAVAAARLGYPPGARRRVVDGRF